MKVRTNIALFALAALLAGCQELPRYFAGDEVLAQAGDRQLRRRDVKSVVPQGVSGEDSIAFMAVYVDRWVRKQLKLQEAEVLFSSSAEDIDKMVEEYRQALLIRKLEQYYVDRLVDTTFADDEIVAYYDAHRSDFRLDRTIVKGRIVRVPDRYRQAARLKTLMGSPAAARQRDFGDICEKNNFEISDFRDHWIDYQEFLNCLPTLRSQNYDAALKVSSVQEMRDSHSLYLFQIDAVRYEGEAIPLERLRGTIRRILFNHRQTDLIRRHEEELYRRAEQNGEVEVPERLRPAAVADSLAGK